jgi:RING finger family protein
MTMEEVDGSFPRLKYRAWRLRTGGGVLTLRTELENVKPSASANTSEPSSSIHQLAPHMNEKVAKDIGTPSSPSASDNTILPAGKHSSSVDSHAPCLICLDSIQDEDDVRGLTCSHTFHASCVDPWLISRHSYCPLCKADYHVQPTACSCSWRSRLAAMCASRPWVYFQIFSRRLHGESNVTPSHSIPLEQSGESQSPRQLEAGYATA